MSETTVNIIPLYEEETAPKTIAEPACAPAINEEKKTVEDGREQVKKIRKSFAKPLINVISGNIFTREEVVSHLPYVLFLALIALLYIANGYYAEDTVRKLNKEGIELKELRSEFISTKSDLMHVSKQSEVAASVEKKGLGLKESMEPPKKILIKK